MVRKREKNQYSYGILEEKTGINTVCGNRISVSDDVYSCFGDYRR